MSVERFGLGSAEASLIKDILSQVLAHKGSWSVYVFGSRSTLKHRKYSDIDLWIDSSIPLSEGDLSNLKQKFEDSDLPIKVDIVTAGTCFEPYRDRILGERQLWLTST